MFVFVCMHKSNARGVFALKPTVYRAATLCREREQTIRSSFLLGVEKKEIRNTQIITRVHVRAGYAPGCFPGLREREGEGEREKFDYDITLGKIPKEVK